MHFTDVKIIYLCEKPSSLSQSVEVIANYKHEKEGTWRLRNNIIIVSSHNADRPEGNILKIQGSWYNDENNILDSFLSVKRFKRSKKRDR